MISITKEEFNENIDAFSNLLIEELFISNSKIKFEISNIFVRRINGNVYTLIHISLTEIVSLQLTISYDTFYLIPILHFRIYFNDEISFNIEDILKEDELEFNKNLDIQVNSHPILQDSWFSIHPCETSQTIYEFLTASGLEITPETKVLVYLIIWFNLYGPSGIFQSIKFRPNLMSYYSKKR